MTADQTRIEQLAALMSVPADERTAEQAALAESATAEEAADAAWWRLTSKRIPRWESQ